MLAYSSDNNYTILIVKTTSFKDVFFGLFDYSKENRIAS